MKQTFGLQWERVAAKPRANALGWYETGPWPESEGAFSYAQIGKRGGRYMRTYPMAAAAGADVLLETVETRSQPAAATHPAGQPGR